MAATDDDFNEAKMFDEYNPHPYQGGYDIALTYGCPLPPSAAICYPLSSSSSSSSSSLEAPPPPPPPAQKEEPATVRDGRPSSPAVPDDPGFNYQGESEKQIPSVSQEPEYNDRPSEPKPYSNLFGFWSSFFRGNGESYGWRDAGEERYVYSPQGAGDYLFGYLHCYGEKRDESHHYGNLNYAYERHSPEQPLSVQVDPNELSWWQNLSYHEDYQEQAYEGRHYEESQLVNIGKRDESHHYGNLNYAYERHNPEQPISHQVYPNEPSWWENLSYHEDYQEQAYEGHGYEEPQYVNVELDDLSWPQKLSYQQLEYPQSECVYAYERHSYEEPLSVQIEPVEHSWSEKLNFFEPYEEQAHMQLESVSQYNRESQFYEQPLYAEVDPVEPTWYQRPSYYELYREEVRPQPKQDAGSRKTNVEQTYCPFRKYSGYDD